MGVLTHLQCHTLDNSVSEFMAIVLLFRYYTLYSMNIILMDWSCQNNYGDECWEGCMYILSRLRVSI